jgi:hypothetical protein
MPCASRIFASLIAFLAFCAAAHQARAEDLAQRRAALYVDYARQLGELAEWCEGQQLPDAAETLRTWLPERGDDHLTLFVISSADETGPDLDDAEWQGKWQKMRIAQAEGLFSLALTAAKAGQAGLAYELATETLRENPEHKQARRALGYVRFRDQWRMPFEIRQLSAGKVWHDRFGWLPKSHIERYEKGERYYQGRWMSTANEQAQRSEVKRGWRVESSHYIVTTNHSLEEGVRLSRQLETLHAIWQQAFAAFHTDDVELRRRFEGRGIRSDIKPHNVVYYRSRDEYNRALGATQPKIEITLGIYLDKARTAYFFAGDEQDPGTVFHEATHQLFHETRPASSEAGHRDNFWIMEGIACYMESLAEAGNHYTLGGANAGRMPAARQRLNEDHFYIPLSELVSMGVEAVQHDPRIAMLYSQSSGLADFFMHDATGRYREPLVRYLVAIYGGRANAGTLSELVGKSYSALDREYREFMSATSGEPAESAASR